MELTPGMTDVALDTPLARGSRRRLLVRLPSPTPEGHLVFRAIIFICLVVLAYHYSLTTIIRSLNSETPLAYLGLVPVIALLLAVVRIRPAPYEPPIHDRQ